MRRGIVRAAPPPAPGAARRGPTAPSPPRARAAPAGPAQPGVRGGRAEASRAGARAARPPRAEAHRARPLARPPARGAAPSLAALRAQRRERTPWDRLTRERLLSAWARLLRDTGLPAHDLRLLGVWGPVPLGAVEEVALRPDGRLALRMGPRAVGPTGDIVLARHVPTGRLLRGASPGGARARVR